MAGTIGLQFGRSFMSPINGACQLSTNTVENSRNFVVSSICLAAFMQDTTFSTPLTRLQ